MYDALADLLIVAGRQRRQIGRDDGAMSSPRFERVSSGGGVDDCFEQDADATSAPRSTNSAYRTGRCMSRSYASRSTLASHVCRACSRPISTAIVTGGGTGIGLAIAKALGARARASSSPAARRPISMRGSPRSKPRASLTRRRLPSTCAIPASVDRDGRRASIATPRPHRHPDQQRRRQLRVPRRRSLAQRLERRHRHRAQRQLLLLARRRPAHDRGAAAVDRSCRSSRTTRGRGVPARSTRRRRRPA